MNETARHVDGYGRAVDGATDGGREGRHARYIVLFFESVVVLPFDLFGVREKIFPVPVAHEQFGAVSGCGRRGGCYVTYLSRSSSSLGLEVRGGSCCLRVLVWFPTGVRAVLEAWRTGLGVRLVHVRLPLELEEAPDTPFFAGRLLPRLPRLLKNDILALGLCPTMKPKAARGFGP